MGNSYFQFKTFRVDQDRAAMKVSTDSCIQGAWSPLLDSWETALDLGSGTGLLALFLAHRHPGLFIDALEIDPVDAEQGRQNLAASPWSRRLRQRQGDHLDYEPSAPYDFICTNPPFFVDRLLAADSGRVRARHLLDAEVDHWVESIDRLLAPQGHLSIMYPTQDREPWAHRLQAKGMHVWRELWISAYAPRPAYRQISLWTRDPMVLVQPPEVLYIYQGKGKPYTPSFSALMRPYYLFL